MKRSMCLYVVVVALAVCIGPSGLQAQTNTGVITGTVTDPTGAVIPGARVVIGNPAQGTQIALTTNAVGNYLSPILRIGTYEVRVEAPGFQASVRRNVELHVNDRLNISFELQPGAVTEVVEVSGGAPLINTTAGDVSSVIDSRAVVDLPLEGRRYIDLMLLAPGVVQAEGGEGDNPREGRFAVDGNQTLHNYFVLNGVDNNSFTQNVQDASPQAARPPPDALQEFKIQTRTYSAEFGWSMGAVINAEIRSGSNDFHGGVWWFHRNDQLNATSFFLNSAGVAKPEEVRNQWGFAVGGPIWRDHAFFFFDYDDSHWGKGTSAFGRVPTALERVGDFSANPISFDASSLASFTSLIPEQVPCLLLDDPVNPTQLLGLNLTATRTDGVVCGDPVGLALIDLYPLPTGPSPRDYFGAPSVPEDQWSYDLRIDGKLGDSDSIYGVYDRFDVVRVIERGPFENPISPGSFSANSKVRTHVFSLAWVHLFGATIVNDARMGVNYVYSASSPLAPQGDLSADYGLTGMPGGPYAYGLPPITVSGFEIIGTNRWRPQDTRSQVWQFIDNLSWIHGRHSMKFGFEWKRAINNFLDIRSPAGEINIPGSWTGLGVANLLLGNVSGARVTSPLVPHNYVDGTMFYAQDSWRATPTLTVNYGVRYEYFTPVIERDRQTSNIDPEANGGRGALITINPMALPATPGCSDPAGNPSMTNNPTGTPFECLIRGPSGDSIFARTLIHPDYNNIAPRVSVAWQFRDRFVLRGGYAIFYQAFERMGSDAILQLNPPHQFETRDSASSSEPPIFFLRDGFPIQAAPPTEIDLLWGLSGSLRGRDMNEKAPYAHQWSFGPQVELTPDLSLEVTYVGQDAKDLRWLHNIGQGRLVTPGDRTSVVWPFPDWREGRFGSGFLTNEGWSNYHSLQVNLRKRYSQTPVGGLAFNVAYTWSKAMGTVSGYLVGGAAGGAGGAPMNVYDLDANYGPLSYHQPHRIVTNWQWELPIGPGQPYLNEGLAAKLLGDWQFNGIWHSTSGTPIGIGASDQTGTRGGGGRADCIGTPSTAGRTVERYMSPDAFRVPADGYFGNCSVALPGIYAWPRHNFDMSLFKNFSIDEARRFELRFEFFNIWNTPQFRPPGSTGCSGLAGQPCDPSGFARTTSTKRPFVGDARVIQLGVKFYF